MDPGPAMSPWLARCQQPMTLLEEQQVLTAVLAASTSEAAALQQLARATACPAVVRCAALDRYVGVLGPTATPVLEALADFRREPSEPVRTVAHQWLAWVAGQTAPAASPVVATAVVHASAGPDRLRRPA